MQKIFFAICILAVGSILAQRYSPPLEIILPDSHSRTTATSIKDVYLEITKRLKEELSLPPPQSITIVICSDMDALNRLCGHTLPSWVLGIAISEHNTIGINGAALIGIGNRLPAVLRHEICHLYLGEWERQNGKPIPQWFNEGVCEWISGRLHFDYQDQISSIAVWKQAIPLQQLSRSFPQEAGKASQAYLQSQSVVEFLVAKYQREVVPELLRCYQQTEDFDMALLRTTGMDIEQLQEQWLSSVTPSFPWIWQFLQIFSLGSLFILIFLLAYWRQRRKNKRLLAQWEEEERWINDDFGN